MFSYQFTHIGDFNQVDFNKPVIWVLNATKTPPHIGLSIENKYFSLKANGKDESIDIKNIIDLVDRKQIPTLFIELDLHLSLNEVEKSYQKFNKAGENQSTCLSPISQLVDASSARQLSELLQQIDGKITRVAGLNLPQDYQALPSYSIETIHQHIEDLKIYVGE